MAYMKLNYKDFLHIRTEGGCWLPFAESITAARACMKTLESEPRAEEFGTAWGYTPHIFRLSKAFAIVGRKTHNRGDDVAIVARLLGSIFRSRAERYRPPAGVWC
jgi:hypothetical protein